MKKTDFNEGWLFRAQEQAFQNVCLPHDAMQEQKREPEAPSGRGGAFYRGGLYEYEKHFCVPEEWKTKEVELEIEGVNPHAKVSLNGKEIGRCYYGYSGYRFVLDSLEFGMVNSLTI